MADWESLYQTGDTGWDKGAPAPPLVDWLSKNKIDGLWLVPGCGRGHDVASLAGAGASKVTGLDLSPTPIAEAREHYGSRNMEWMVGDLFALPNTLDSHFDGVFEHTCYCAIPRDSRDDYVRAVHAALKPGGFLLAVFYINPRDNPDPTLGPPFSATLDELDARFSPYFTLEQDEVPTVAYPGREGRERLQLYRKRAVH